MISYPMIIQGGMGAGVSGWLLAQAVSKMGQLGVVSGTAQDTIFARRLQLGDPGGHYRRALEHFPIPEIAQKILDKYFIPGGKSVKEAFKKLPSFTKNPSKSLQELTIVANFAEVFLAKEGHKGPVGINLLEKIRLPNIYSLYGAMLAGVNYVIMGAGIPREIPGVLDKLARHEEVSLKLDVEKADPKETHHVLFNPKELLTKTLPNLTRPLFLGIISSVTLGLMMAKKATGKVDGFVIEGPTAGGHNAPPRGKNEYNEKGEPIYTERDSVDLEKIKEIGLPFWLAGSYGTPEKLLEALKAGAKGIQAGTIFAFCTESGFCKTIKEKIFSILTNGEAEVLTDAKASPTGFPFKVTAIEGTLSEDADYQERPRVCDLGYLRTIYKKEDGSFGYRCPAEPVEQYVKKGGNPEDTEGRKCLCNALVANLGLQQLQPGGYLEKFFVTAGNDIKSLAAFVKNVGFPYSASDVVQYLLSLVK